MTRAQVQEAFGAIGLFGLGIWVAAAQRPWRFPKFIHLSISRELRAQTYFTLGLFAFAVAFCRFAVPCKFDLLEMCSSLGESRFNAPWSRGDLGGWDAILDHMAYFGYILPMLTVVVATRTRWSDPRTVVLGTLSLVIAAFLAQSGGRRIIGVIFGSATAYWVLSRPRIRARHLGLAALLVAAILLVLQLMLDYRNVGLGAFLKPVAEADLEHYQGLRVDDNFLRLGQIVSIFPDQNPYVYRTYFLWVIVRPVPRVLWPGKPVDLGFDLAAYLGAPGVSYSCSVLGELFMAGGLLCVFMGGWLYGRLAGAASRLLLARNEGGALMLYCAFLLALFAGLRSMIELVLMSYVVLVWLLLMWIARAFLEHRTASFPRKARSG
jgi:hypothetical protein